MQTMSGRVVHSKLRCCASVAQQEGVSGSGRHGRSFARTSSRRTGLEAVVAETSRGGLATEGAEDEMVRRIIVERGVSGREAAAELATPPLAMGLTDTDLDSTLQQQVWTGLGCAAVMATAVKAGAAAASTGSVGLAMAALGLGAGYMLADLGSGVYHWGIDNYGDAKSPVFGSQIDAFQGHHKRPWTITKRAFCNNTHALARPVASSLAPFLLLPDSAAGDAFLAAFLGFILLSQQIHAWAHSKKSELPALVGALQDTGVLVSRKMHCSHHRSPYDINYCIVSGLWNPVLDSSRAFARLERAIFSRTGITPRSWSDTSPDWLQQTAYFEDGTHTDSSHH